MKNIAFKFWKIKVDWGANVLKCFGPNIFSKILINDDRWRKKKKVGEGGQDKNFSASPYITKKQEKGKTEQK